MANDALLEAIERLRANYGQRLRLVNNLATALKGTTSALSKAGRSLRDYAEQPGAANGASQSQAAFGALRLREEAIDPLQPELRREVKQLTAFTAALKDASVALQGEAVDVVRLGRALNALQASKLQAAGLAELLPQLEQELEQAARGLGDTFGLALRHALAEQGIELGGRPPRFEIGRFELIADFVARSATLSYGKTLVRKRVPLSVEAVVKAYQHEERSLSGRNEEGARWIAQLYEAWEVVRRKRNNNEPRANIADCFYELVLIRQPRAFRLNPGRSTMVDYSRAQFAYDFFEFTNRQPLLYRGLRVFAHTATKSQTESAERSIWIVEGDGPHDGRYIADIKFDRDE